MTNSIVKISIITVCYNSVKTIEQTFKSVIKQNYNNLEYIVIDAGSTDGTIDIIKKYGNIISKWISEPDNGISDAFNKGIKLCTGDIIGIINSDDWYEDNAFNEIALNFNSADIFHGKVQYWKGDKKMDLFHGNHEKLEKEMTINHMSLFVKPIVYKNYGFFDTNLKYAMDYDLVLRFWVKNEVFLYLPKTIANMRLDGASDKNWIYAYKESMHIKDKVLEKKFKHKLYFVFQILRTLTRKTLEYLNLSFIIKRYRSNFSILEKV